MTVASETRTAFNFKTVDESNDNLSVDFRSGLAGDTTVANGSTHTKLNSTIAGELDNIINVASSTSAITGLTFSNLESAIDSALGKIGNSVQRLDAKDDFLTSAIANSQASVSRLFDADMAMEQLNATKASIGGQAATAMLAQLNMAPQAVLQLMQ
jgi:flagellin